MKINIAQNFDFTKSTPEYKNFVKRGRILHARHLFCVKEVENESSVPIIALCWQISDLKISPHEVRGTLLFNGVIDIDTRTSV